MPGVLDTNTEVDGRRVLRSHSFSGRENNSALFNRGGNGFVDVSGVSGIDSIADGRAFAYFDYDRDGKTDLVLTNSNNPQLQLFHNDMRPAGNSVMVRLVGGNQSSQPSDEWSPRDGYGAHVIVETGGRSLRRELRCGDGFAAQNSRTLTIGIGSNEIAEKISVAWPSGKRSELTSISTGRIVTVFENQAEAESSASELTSAELPAPTKDTPPVAVLDLPIDADLAVVVTMATWCPICLREIPHLARLSSVTKNSFTFYGLPIDPKDDSEKLVNYENENAPPYEILKITAGQRESILQLMNERFGDQPLPITLIVERSGKVVHFQKGTPTLSQLRSLSPPQ